MSFHPADVYQLTEQEQALLVHMVEVTTKRELAERLGVTMDTVKQYFQQIKRKTRWLKEDFPELGRRIRDREDLIDFPLNTPQMFTCTECRCLNERDQFVGWPNDMRCASCIRDQLVNRRQKQRLSLAEKALREIYKKARTGQVVLPSASLIVSDAYKHYGSREAFIGDWMGILKKNKEERPHSSTTAKMYEAFFKLHLEARKVEGEQGTVDDMSDDEIDQELRGMVTEVLQSLEEEARTFFVTEMAKDPLDDWVPEDSDEDDLDDREPPVEEEING